MKQVHKKIANIIIGFSILSVSMTGCAYKSISHGTEITEEQVNTIVDGKTTREQIMIGFGDPAKTMDNEKAYFYNWTRGGKGHFLGIGSGSAYSQSLVVIFDEKGVVKNHKISRGTTEAKADVND